jgi:hypothetical protein
LTVLSEDFLFSLLWLMRPGGRKSGQIISCMSTQEARAPRVRDSPARVAEMMVVLGHTDSFHPPDDVRESGVIALCSICFPFSKKKIPTGIHSCWTGLTLMLEAWKASFPIRLANQGRLKSRAGCQQPPSEVQRDSLTPPGFS